MWVDKSPTTCYLPHGLERGGGAAGAGQLVAEVVERGRREGGGQDHELRQVRHRAGNDEDLDRA
jgi:hypothetical protein